MLSLRANLQRPLAAALVYAAALLLAISVQAGDATGAADAIAEAEGYRLGTGDKLAISVLGEEELSVELSVNDKGAINYPFLGTLKVAGLTIEELRDRLVSGLKPAYLLDPRVTVQVTEYRLFFVNGEVKNPGGFPWQPGMTLRKAAALAGGFTQRASRSQLFIIRDDNPDRTPERVGVDARVGPGDIITIDQSFF